MTRSTASAIIYLVLVAVAITSKIWPFPYGREIGVGLTVAFLVLEFSRAPRLQRNVGMLLFGLGAVAAWIGGDLSGALIDGLERSQIFLVMFFAVMWLREPAVTSPSLKSLRDAVVVQPAGRRYPILWLSGHFLGSVLNLAALSLLSSMVADQKDARLRKRLSLGLMLGFTTASTWGPFYVSISVVLSAIPGLSWFEIAPLGLGLSAFLLAVGWSYDRIFLREKPSPGSVRAGRPLTPKTIGRAGIVLVQLVFLVMGAHELMGLSIPIALGVIAPPFAIAWAWVQVQDGARWTHGAAPLIRRIFTNLPELRNEAIAFVAASVLGVGVSKVLPPETIGAALAEYGVHPDLVMLSIVFGISLLGMAGLHPVVIAILVGEVLPPDVIGIAPQVLAVALLGVWGTSTMVSPFSATTLFMARVVGLPSHVIAWRWGPPMIALTTCVVAGYVVIIRHLLYS